MSEEKDTEGVIVDLLYELAADGITGEQQREWRQEIAGRIQRFMTDSESEINRSAYERGRADALRELGKGEPDGWACQMFGSEHLSLNRDNDNKDEGFLVYKGTKKGAMRKFAVCDLEIIPVKIIKMENLGK